MGELLPTGTQRLERELLHVHKNALKTNEKENRPNRANLGRHSRGKSKTGGTQGAGRSSVPVPEEGPVLLLRWLRPQQHPPQDGRRHGARANTAAAPPSVSPYRASPLGPYLKWRPQAARGLNMVPSVLMCLKMAACVLANSIPTSPQPGGWTSTSTRPR